MKNQTIAPIIKPEMLTESRKYRVRYKNTSGKGEKEMVARYMGTGGKYLLFDLRPHAGTSRLYPREITGVWVTTEPVHVPRKVNAEKQERRVF